MSFIIPMFAASMPKVPVLLQSGDYVAEEKFDGHRLIAEVDGKDVVAWSRNGLQRALPSHVRHQLSLLPSGIYDGELLVPGKRSYGVTELINGPDLVYTIFDILQYERHSVESLFWSERREILDEIFFGRLKEEAVRTSDWHPVTSEESLSKYLNEVWERDGEGLILKRRDSIYLSGKRPKNSWIKMKQLHTSVMEIIGFLPSRGQINNRGAYAMVRLRDEEGHETTVKTLNDEELASFEKRAPKEDIGFSLGEGIPHPDIGQKLLIEFQEHTPYCDVHRKIPCHRGFRHPRWDRWVNR